MTSISYCRRARYSSIAWAQRPAGAPLLQPRETHLEAVADDVLEVAVQRESLGTWKFGRYGPVSDRSTLHRSAIATVLRIASGKVAEDRGHLVGRLQVELIAVVAHPLGVVHGAAGADAEQHVVRAEVVAPEVVHVVRADQRDAHLARQGQEAVVHHPLLLDAWNCSSRKKLPAPRMSRYVAAAFAAASAWSARSALGTSPFRQLLSPMSPFAVSGQQFLVRFAACSRSLQCRPTMSASRGCGSPRWFPRAG